MLPSVHTNLGTVLRMLQRPRDAIQSFTRALELDPEFESARAGLGTTPLTIGEHRKGLLELRNARGVVEFCAGATRHSIIANGSARRTGDERLASIK
jgi:hypothetical protein